MPSETDAWPASVGIPAQARQIGSVDNSSIEGMRLTAWQMPFEQGQEYLVLLEDTFPYDQPQKQAVQVFALLPEDLLQVQAKGYGGRQFVAIETRVLCYRQNLLLWQVDFELNSHWGGVSHLEIIASIQKIAAETGVPIQLKEALLPDSL